MKSTALKLMKLEQNKIVRFFSFHCNPQMGISGIEVYQVISKNGLKSHENQSAYIKNLILWVCREC